MSDTDVLEKLRLAEADCLSGWLVSRAAMGQPLPRSAEAHVSSCELCQARIREEAAEVAAAGYAPIPDAVRQAMERVETQGAVARWRSWMQVKRRRRMSWLLAMMAVSASAAGIAVTVLPTEPNELTKGNATIQWKAALWRRGRVHVQNVSLAELPRLEPGDKIRLRSPPDRSWIEVEGFEQDQWMTYFEGDPPKEGWLPFSVELLPGPPASLRIRECLDLLKLDCRTTALSWTVVNDP